MVAAYPDNFLRNQGMNAPIKYLPHVAMMPQSKFELNPSIRVTSQVPELPVPFHIYVHSPENCRFISKNLVETGRWEDLISKRLMHIMATRPNGLFVDVGANIGWFTLLIAAMGRKVIAIEPMRYNLELLEASVTESELAEHVTIHKTAVGEHTSDTKQDMCVLPAFSGDPTANAGNGQLHALTAENTGLCTDVVETSTLDMLLGDHIEQQIVAIKLDIEGFETLALRGASELLQSNPPCHIIVEYWREYVEWTNVGQYEMFELLWKHGYKSFSLGTTETEFMSSHLSNHAVPDGDYEFRHKSCLVHTEL